MTKYNKTQLVAYGTTCTGVLVGLWLMRRMMQSAKSRKQHIGAYQTEPDRWSRNTHLELPVWPAKTNEIRFVCFDVSQTYRVEVSLCIHDDMTATYSLQIIYSESESGVSAPIVVTREAAVRFGEDNALAVFEADKLKIECLSPFERWRVTYSGPVSVPQKPHDKVHARVSLFWRAFSLPIDVEPLANQSIIVHNHQWGQLDGTVELECIHTDHSTTQRTLSIREYRGVRERFVLCGDAPLSFQQQFGMLEDGKCFYITEWDQHMRSYLTMANGISKPLTSFQKLSAATLSEYRARLTSHVYEMVISGQYADAQSATRCFPITVTYKAIGSACPVGGTCFEELRELRARLPLATTCMLSTTAQCPALDLSAAPCLVSIADPTSLHESLVGGKCVQLAFLTQHCSAVPVPVPVPVPGSVPVPVPGSDNSLQFTVPPAVCVTTNAYRQHVAANSDVLAALQRLKVVLSEHDETALIQQCCKQVEGAFERSELSCTLRDAVQKFVEGHSAPYAVRSSAIGEDSAVRSGAGQLETFLGVKTVEEVLTAVKKCFASSFSYRAVEYRRQNALELCPPCAVIIQEMVKAETSGVTFTVDPISGNAYTLLIDAVFGLGEGAVSGSGSADSVKFLRDPEVARKGHLKQESLQLISYDAAEKTQAISLNGDAGGGGTKVEQLKDERSAARVLSDENAHRLAKLGLYLEACFASPRDIEWAMNGSQIYLLQSRPITTGREVPMTDDEHLHEFDSGVSSLTQCFTTANIQEMMAGPVTPLGVSIFLNACAGTSEMRHWRAQLVPEMPTTLTVVQCFAMHGFFNLHKVCIAMKPNMLVGSKEDLEFGILGKSVPELKEESLADYNFVGGGFFEKLKRFQAFGQTRTLFSSKFESLENAAPTFQFERSDDPVKMYDIVSAGIPVYIEAVRVAMAQMENFMGMASLIVLIVSGSSNGTGSHNTDVALLLGQSKNVISADVPFSVNRLAEAIVKSDYSQAAVFAALKTKDTVAWMKAAPDDVQSVFKHIIKVHGHRCVREAEMYERAWRNEPEKLLVMVQAAVQAKLKLNQLPNKDEAQAEPSADDLIAQLQTPLSGWKKRVIKYALPKAREGIAGRERCKSMWIAYSNALKEAYWHLADLLRRNCMLPTADLLFFMTHRELGHFIKHPASRSGLLSKAVQRNRIYKRANEFCFEEIVFGVPKPMDTSKLDVGCVAGTRLTGLPVSRGRARGRAFVIHSIEQARDIQQGDILIARLTDIGWTPLYPSISGLVTEIGAMASHGSTIAREYNLPCIVRCANATRALRTGDMVILDANAGYVEKISDSVTKE